MMKKTIDTYFTKKYKFLRSVVVNVNRAKNIPDDLHDDLINELYLFIIKNIHKIEPIIEKSGENGLEAFCVMWLKNQSRWISDFKKQNEIHKSFKSEYIVEFDNRLTEDLYFVKEDEIDLIERFSDEQIYKIKKTYKIIEGFEQYEKNLFELYFTQQLTMAQISQMVGISKGSVFNLLHEMYKKIKTKIKC
jgi:RNA polymerase sigma factor (sigma-70 family)